MSKTNGNTIVEGAGDDLTILYSRAPSSNSWFQFQIRKNILVNNTGVSVLPALHMKSGQSCLFPRVRSSEHNSHRVTSFCHQPAAKALSARPPCMYAFMQAMGLVNDHLHGCHMRAPLRQARAGFTPPRG